MGKAGGNSSGSETMRMGVHSAGLATFVFFGKFLSLLFGAAMLIILARVLGPSQYGVYVVALATAGFISAFGSINIGAYFNKKLPQLIAEKRIAFAGSLIGDSLIFTIAVSCVLTAAGILLSGSVSGLLFGSQAHYFEIALASASIFWIIAYPMLNTTLIGVGTGKELALSTMSSLVLQSTISIVLVLFGFGADGAIFGYLSGFALAAVLTGYYINRHVPISISFNGMRRRLREMLSFSMPLTLSGILGTLTSNFAVMFLGMLLISSAVIGQYGVAQKIGNVIDLASGAISVVLVPMFATAIYRSQSLVKIGKLYHASLYYGLLFTAPMVVYASVLSRDIILTVFTQSYTLAVLYMPLISVGILIGLVGGYASSILISYGMVRRILRFSLYTTAVQFASILILGWLFRVIGVIFGYFFIGSTVSSFLYMHELHRTGLRVRTGPILRMLLSNTVLGIALIPLIFLQIRPLYVLFLGLAEAFIVYPAALAKTHAISSDDLGVLRKVGSEMPLVGNALLLIIRYAEALL
jgi:O-antigen/teichoic acid export membrane protein